MMMGYARALEDALNLPSGYVQKLTVFCVGTKVLILIDLQIKYEYGGL
jgi:hypothetical protein